MSGILPVLLYVCVKLQSRPCEDTEVEIRQSCEDISPWLPEVILPQNMTFHKVPDGGPIQIYTLLSAFTARSVA